MPCGVRYFMYQVHGSKENKKNQTIISQNEILEAQLKLNILLLTSPTFPVDILSYHLAPLQTLGPFTPQ